ncbi:MAG: FmdB family zinc ribbon protein [Vicinamibacteria bacterium]
MPLYEYQCEACGHRFEVIQKYSDAPIETCPKCEGVVRKLLSSPAIQFKGTGWYITDYARAGKGGESSSATPATTSTSDSKADTKPETKSDSAPAKTDAPKPAS